MRIFGSERMDSMLQRLGLKEGEAIVHPWINKALEKAQQKVEARNFESRKNILKFDDVMNDQRKVIYEQRRELMVATDVSQTIAEMRQETVGHMVEQHIPANSYAEQWNAQGLHEEALRIFGLDLPVVDWAKEEGIAEQEIHERLSAAVEKKMAEKEERSGSEVMRFAEKSILLQLLDQQWKDHLLNLDHLRQGIWLRAHGQRDPLNEYKREAFEMFDDMLTRVRESVTVVLSHIEVRLGPPPEEQAPPPRRPSPRPGCGNPARARLWPSPAPTPSPRRRRKTSARSPATPPAPAAPARSTSTATGGCNPRPVRLALSSSPSPPERGRGSG